MKLLIHILALPFLASFASLYAADASRPNIIVIVADDLGWGDLSCYPKGKAWGEEAYVPTPNLDALAASGVRCTQAYATCMVCSPSRAALLAGQYQQRFGFYGFGETTAPFPKRLKLLPEALRECGYTTGMVGKWHVSFVPGSGPLDRGFERFFGFLGGQHDYFAANLGQPLHTVENATDGFILDQDRAVPKVKYLTDEFTDRAIDFLAEADSKPQPFFLYLAYSTPHPPMQALWQDLEAYAKLRPQQRFTSRDIARAMIANLDRNVGRLTRWLRENNLDKNTLVVFTSDNGGSDDGPGHVVQHNGGLRGRKGYFYEGGIRVPFIMSWRAQLPAGLVYDRPVSNLDIYTTAIAAANHAEIRSLPLDGVNLLPHFTDKVDTAPHARMYWSLEKPAHWAVRDGDWKLVREDTNPTLNQRAGQPNFRLQLYDLASDPTEQSDLAGERPETVARLQKLFDGFVAQSKPSLLTAELDAANKAALAERQKNPALRSLPRSDGSPRHWIGAGAKERLASESSGPD